MSDEPVKFRKQALEYVSEPAKLDDSLEVISPKGWILLIISVLIISGCMCWLFFGSIESQINGTGILLSSTASIVNVSGTGENGTVEDIHVNVGQEVKQNTLLVTLSNDLLVKQINEKKTYLNKLLQEKQNLIERETIATAQEKELLEGNVNKLQESLNEANSKLQQLQKLMEIKEAAYKKGIVIIDAVTDAKVNYYNLLQEIRSHEAALIQTKATIYQFVDTWKERQREMDDNINKTKEELAELENTWQYAHYIYSPVAGTISEIQVKKYDMVTKGQILINIVPNNQKLYALAFVTAEKGKNIQTGMQAQVNPTQLKKLEFGSIEGSVVSVSDFPVSENYITAILNNPALTQSFLANGPVFAIKIQLDKNQNTVSGYKWTTSNGPNSHLTQGSMIAVTITAKKIRPITLFISIAKGL